MLGDAAHLAVDRGGVQLIGHLRVLGKEPDVALAVVVLESHERDQADEPSCVVDVDAARHRQPGQAAVQHARVAEAVAHLLGGAHSDRALAAAARPVDAHHEAPARLSDELLELAALRRR